jgi:hypothetical protein
MFYRPMIEVEDGAAFLTMAKELKPVGRVIVFEYDKNRYKFFSRQGDDLVAVTHKPNSTFPVSTPRGQVTHGIPIDLRTFELKQVGGLGYLFKKLDVTTRLADRTKKVGEAIKKCLASDRPTKMKWKSNSERIVNLNVKVHNDGTKATLTVEYTDVTVRELTKMLESAGYKVVPGRISMQ